MTVTASGNKKNTAKVSGPSSDTQAQSGIEKGYSQLSKTVGTYLRKTTGAGVSSRPSDPSSASKTRQLTRWGTTRGTRSKRVEGQVRWLQKASPDSTLLKTHFLYRSRYDGFGVSLWPIHPSAEKLQKTRRTLVVYDMSRQVCEQRGGGRGGSVSWASLRADKHRRPHLSHSSITDLIKPHPNPKRQISDRYD